MAEKTIKEMIEDAKTMSFKQEQNRFTLGPINGLTIVVERKEKRVDVTALSFGHVASAPLRLIEAGALANALLGLTEQANGLKAEARDRDDVTLSLVRALGFDNMIPLHGDAEERVFFVGPLGERGAHASEEAIKEFIAYYERQIETAQLYLANGRNNKTHEWVK